MKKETLKVGIASYEQMKVRTMAVARGELKPGRGEPKVWFTSVESFARVLSDRNRALLQLIAESDAYSDEADHDSRMMVISIPGSWRAPSERSDAGLFHDPEVIAHRFTLEFDAVGVVQEAVGLEGVDDGVWRVWFGPVLLGLLDEKGDPRSAKNRSCSHWPPVIC